MQRYHGAGCTSAVNNSAIGGASARDTSRADSSSLPPNFQFSSRWLFQNTILVFALVTDSCVLGFWIDFILVDSKQCLTIILGYYPLMNFQLVIICWESFAPVSTLKNTANLELASKFCSEHFGLLIWLYDYA